jgi:glycosyltransferase involved in cell wall biosynthesis
VPLEILVFNWLDRQHPRSGGAEVHLHEVFGRLVRAGHRVTLVASGWPGGAARAVVDGIDVHRVGGRESYYIHARPYYRRVLAERRFDVAVEDLNKAPLFTPAWVDAPVALLVHHLFGSAAFVSASPPVAVATWALERVVGMAYRGLDTIAVSESTAEELVRLGMSADRIAVIHNGVDERLLETVPLGLRDPEPTVLYLGRVERYKRVDLIVRAIGRIRDAGDFARLIVAGDGRQTSALRRLVSRLGLDDRVSFAGRVSDTVKRTLMERAWVHAITSMKEGWGITVLEAAACGTPTIASDTPGLRDAVVHGESGLLVRHGDVDALADTIRSLIADHGRLEKLALGARARAERFTWNGAASAIGAHLSFVASGRTPPLAGAWARFRRTPSHATVGLPRTGTGVAPFGAASWIVDAARGDVIATARVSVGAYDASGRRVVAIVRVLHGRAPVAPDAVPRVARSDGHRESLVCELPGWPRDHESFLRDVLERAFGAPLSLGRVRRVAEPLAMADDEPPDDEAIRFAAR